MAKFTYSAVTKDSKHRSGKVEADSREAAIKLLSKEGLKPLSIKREGGFDPNDIKIPGLNRKKVKTKDLAVFSRQLATMVNAGVPLVRALNLLSQQTNNDYFREAIEGLAKDVEGGGTLSDALSKYPKIFSPIYTNMVAAGETGGILDDILKRLAFQQEKDASIKKKIKSASAYPAVLVFVAVTAFFGLMLFIVPQIAGVIADVSNSSDASLPFYTQILLDISNFMVANWMFIIAGFVVVIIGLTRYVKTEKGRYNFDKLLLKLPIIKLVVTKVAIARFSRIFASLMGAGVGVLDSITVTAKAIGNKVIEEELMAAAKQVKNGEPLSIPLATSSVFPPIVAQMLAVGEETGEIDVVLVKIADFYEEEVDALVDGLSSIIEPVMIVLLGGMVGLIALAVIGPLSSISKNL